MTEAVKTEPRLSGISLVLSAWHDPVARILNVDLLTVLIAILLPWSTTGVVIAVVLWIFALITTLEIRPFLRSLKRPIGALPIAFFALALIGTLWSDASWGARFYAVGPTAKLLALPLLLYHYERSSWLVAFDPGLALKSGAEYGVPVKNYIDQSQEFALCAVALAYPILTLLRTKRIPLAVLLTALALGFVVNMSFVVISRTALATMPILLALFALLHLKCRTVIVSMCVAAVLAAVVWNASPTLRTTASKFVSDYRQTRIQNNPSGVGSRLEYWQKSLDFFAEAPVIGHGTGSTRGLFAQAAIGETGAQAEIVGNPHNQTLNAAVQWGVIGIVVLYAMWIFHLSLFRGEGWVNWVGLLVVVQNVVTSLFNSHLFDFVEGWMYVVGVGVAGGMTLNARQSQAGSPALPRSSCWQALRSVASTAINAAAARPVFSKVLGGLAVFAVLVFGTLFYFDFFQAPPVNTPLAREIRSMMAALKAYHASRGAYPISDRRLVDLKQELAKGGYLGPDSGDFSGVDQDAYYLSVNGKSYDLLFHVDRTRDNPSGTRCLVEVGRSYIGWDEQLPACRF